MIKKAMLSQLMAGKTDEKIVASSPKTIARIKLCGVMAFDVTDMMSWKKPTEKQIKNLHDMLCIDVEILDGE